MGHIRDIFLRKNIYIWNSILAIKTLAKIDTKLSGDILCFILFIKGKWRGISHMYWFFIKVDRCPLNGRTCLSKPQLSTSGLFNYVWSFLNIRPKSAKCGLHFSIFQDQILSISNLLRFKHKHTNMCHQIFFNQN